MEQLSSDAPGWCSSPATTDGDGPLCWKCEGTGIRYHRKRNRNEQAWLARHPGAPPLCTVCGGRGRLKPKRNHRDHSKDPGVVTTRRRSAPAWVGALPHNTPAGLGSPELGEELCFLTGDWRIFQRRGGHRYTTEDVVTAWVACNAVHRARSGGATQPTGTGTDNPTLGTGGKTTGSPAPTRDLPRGASDLAFRGLDLGTGIGSVLLMTAWRFHRARRFHRIRRARRFHGARRSTDRDRALSHSDVSPGPAAPM